MTLEEMGKAKQVLEAKIALAIAVFEGEARVCVYGVELVHAQPVGSRRETCAVRLDVRL